MAGPGWIEHTPVMRDPDLGIRLEIVNRMVGPTVSQRHRPHDTNAVHGIVTMRRPYAEDITLECVHRGLIDGDPVAHDVLERRDYLTGVPREQLRRGRARPTATREPTRRDW